LLKVFQLLLRPFEPLLLVLPLTAARVAAVLNCTTKQ